MRDPYICVAHPSHTVDHLSRLWRALGNAARVNPAAPQVTGDVEDVTGNRPETLREFLRGRP
jgi:hypothetical protein